MCRVVVRHPACIGILPQPAMRWPRRNGRPLPIDPSREEYGIDTRCPVGCDNAARPSTANICTVRDSDSVILGETSTTYAGERPGHVRAGDHGRIPIVTFPSCDRGCLAHQGTTPPSEGKRDQRTHVVTSRVRSLLANSRSRWPVQMRPSISKPTCRYVPPRAERRGPPARFHLTTGGRDLKSRSCKRVISRDGPRIAASPKTK